jgi:hypothetical protein
VECVSPPVSDHGLLTAHLTSTSSLWILNSKIEIIEARLPGTLALAQLAISDRVT